MTDDVSNDPDDIFPSGVNEDGKPLLGKLDVKKVAAALRLRGVGSASPSVLAASAKAALESMGLPAGVTAGDLSRAGWAVVFADDVSAEIRAALQPLLDRRKAQAGARFKTLAYHPNESIRDWMTRQNISFGTIVPSRVPYHLLLVGSPSSISWEFQYSLDLEYSVGRLWFEPAEGKDPKVDLDLPFKLYAQSVVDYETGPKVPTTKSVLYFGPSRDDDGATTLSSTKLVDPLATSAPDDPSIAVEFGFAETKLLGALATKTSLLDELAKKPAVWFSASHGLGVAKGGANQKDRQGALVTGDWTESPITDAMLLTGAAVEGTQTPGLVAFIFACYGAGTPLVDEFSRDLDTAADPPAIADAPFIARLPQTLMGRANGALAVIGHVERAWAYSIQPPKVDPQIAPFKNAIGRILNGEPVGEALGDFTMRHASISTEMLALLAPNARDKVSDIVLVRRWIEKTDSRNYVLLGDPAVSIRSKEMTV